MQTFLLLVFTLFQIEMAHEQVAYTMQMMRILED